MSECKRPGLMAHLADWFTLPATEAAERAERLARQAHRRVSKERAMRQAARRKMAARAAGAKGLAVPEVHTVGPGWSCVSFDMSTATFVLPTGDGWVVRVRSLAGSGQIVEAVTYAPAGDAAPEGWPPAGDAAPAAPAPRPTVAMPDDLQARLREDLGRPPRLSWALARVARALGFSESDVACSSVAAFEELAEDCVAFIAREGATFVTKTADVPTSAEVFGDPDQWKLISKFQHGGVTKSTKAMKIAETGGVAPWPGGVLVQVSTATPAGVGEALAFIPGGDVGERDGVPYLHSPSPTVDAEG